MYIPAEYDIFILSISSEWHTYGLIISFTGYVHAAEIDYNY